MVTIVTKSNSQAYAIYVDNRKIVECAEPETTFNELIRNIGIDTTNVQIVEMTSYPVTLGTVIGAILQDVIAEATVPVSLDSIIDLVNASMISGPNKNRLSISVTDEQENDEEEEGNEQHDDEDGEDNTAPIGNVEIPKVGNLIYVDGVDGFLRKITGGIGTVHVVYNADANTEHVSVQGIDDENDRMLIELEEIPGVYFSWTNLRDKQSELKAKYGYKPVCSII